ncbi:hypothetical protein JQC91_01220 [Jannaschia sp. Os4]|uniref:hypothetical protein n=1 Tax=Jannaschia sp. Os4 TaxID=2807617 RepID=UPI00193A37B9|nr:hypothetical protein [Jannaschia sp. Os4]MBM2574912.1 hypothetical protein [Jannaschia sp. Os4]
MARKTTGSTGGTGRSTTRKASAAKAGTSKPSTAGAPRDDGAVPEAPKVEDAVVVDETTPAAGGAEAGDATLPVPADPTPDPVEAGAEKARSETAIPIAPESHPALESPDAVAASADGDAAKDDAPSRVDGATAAAATAIPAVAAVPAASERTDRPVEKVVERRGSGFVPLVLGGLVAGGIGWAAATFLPADEGTEGPGDARVAALEAELAALRADLDAVPAAEAPDLSALEAAQADLAARLDALPAEGEDGFDPAPLEARIAALEAAPAAAAEGGAEPEAVAALRADLDALSARLDAVGPPELPEEVAALPATVAELGARVDALPALPDGVADLPDRVAAVEERVAGLREEALANAAAAEASAADALRDRLALAVSTGRPYADALAEMEAAAPEALAAFAETGVPSVAMLQEQWDDAARAALRAARAADPGGGGVGGFLRAQLGARSLEPRTGDDPEAVLSRANAAVAAGEIGEALTEIEALPEAAAAELDGWTAQARARVAALAALDDFASPAANQEGE